MTADGIACTFNACGFNGAKVGNRVGIEGNVVLIHRVYVYVTCPYPSALGFCSEYAPRARDTACAATHRERPANGMLCTQTIAVGVRESHDLIGTGLV